MKIATVGLLCACVLVTLVYLDGVSGRRFSGGGFRGGGSRGSSSRSSRSSRTYRYRSSSSGSSGSSGRGYSQRPRFVPPLLLASSRRRRSTASGFEREQCQRCTTSYIYQNSAGGYFMKGTSYSPGAQEVSICREGTAACNNGACSINYLWANNIITDFPDGKGGENPAVGSISAQVESVLICGTLQLAPKLQVTILAVAMATVMQMIGGT